MQIKTVDGVISFRLIFNHASKMLPIYQIFDYVIYQIHVQDTAGL